MALRNIKQLRLIIRKLHHQKKKVVFTNGCFDLLHIGHVKLFEYCKKQGDYLIVAVNSDSSIRAIKGPARPIIPEKDRARLCGALKPVDAVIVFKEKTPEKLIAQLCPDVLVKGGDWKLTRIVGRNAVKKVIRMPVIKGKSTTAIIQKIRT